MDFETQNVDNILLLNLDKVEFVDSSGLGSLISILKTLASAKGNMAMCRVNSSILNLFSVTRMDKVFFIAKSESEAKEFLEDWRKKNG